MGQRAVTRAALLLAVAAPCSVAHALDPEPARARAAGSVLLVRAPGDERLVARLRAELAGEAYRIVEVRTSDPRVSLSDLAAAHGTHAALRLEMARRAVLLWVAPGSFGASASEERMVAEPGSDDDVLAVRITEALRARGLLLGANDARHEAPRPPLRELAKAPSAERMQEAPVPARRSASLDLSLGGLGSPGGIPLVLAAQGALRVRVHEAASFTLWGMADLGGTSVRGAEGASVVRMFSVGALAEYRVLRLGPRSSLHAGLGVGGVAASLTGTAESAAASKTGTTEDVYVGKATTVYLPAPLGRVAFYVEPLHNLEVFGQALFGVTLPALSVQFHEREVARWGQPAFVFGGLGVAYRWAGWSAQSR